jgi:hypothetical protein
MHLVYIDESGSHDDGSFTSYNSNGSWCPTNKRESKYFILTGLVVHKNAWKECFKFLKNIRENVKVIYGIPLNEHIHATELIGGSGIWRHDSRGSFSRSKRKGLLKNLLHEYAQQKNYYYGSVIVDKTTKFSHPKKCRELAYENLLNRLEKDLKDDYMIIHDGHEDGAIIRLMRKKRVFNYIQGKKFTLEKLIEDPLFKRANNSYFLQAVDHISYTLLHLYDKNLPNEDIGNLYKQSELSKIGNGRMHYKTRDTFPGHIYVPS